MEYKEFDALNATSKFAICGLPIRVDTYKSCSFGCKYCFANSRKIMEFSKELQIANIPKIEKKLKRIFADEEYDKNNFVDTCIAKRYTWHLGGMSDPFQPIESKLHITKKLYEITSEYNIHILASTKTSNLYDAPINPKLHTFQMSVTNVDNRKDIEPCVADIKERYKLFYDLKEKGFKVGIRIQPFIPSVTNTSIIEMFKDADNFTIEGLKLVPQNKEHKEEMLKIARLTASEFTQMGLLNLKVQKRLELYKPFIEKMEEYGLSYSIADNDLHYLGNNYCCCGDSLIDKYSTINSTYLAKKYGVSYTKESLDHELERSGLGNCKCNHLFTSNRQEGCTSVKDFFDKRFDRKTSPFSPKFLYRNMNED